MAAQSLILMETSFIELITTTENAVAKYFSWISEAKFSSPSEKRNSRFLVDGKDTDGWNQREVRSLVLE